VTAQMTGRERLLAAIRHQEPDRVPISPRIAAFLSVYYGSSSWMHHLKAAQEFGFDICLPAASPMPAFIHSPALVYRHLPQEVKVTQAIEEQDGGVTIRRTFETPDGPLSDETFVAPPGREYGVSPSPVKREHLLKTPDDLDRLCYVMPDPARLNLHDYDEISRIIGDAGLVEVTLNPPLDHFLGDARGLSQLMMDYYLDRPFFDRMVALFQAYSLAVLKAMLERGVRYIFGTWYYASLSAGWSPAILRECFIPIVRQHAEQVHRYEGIYHLYDDGKMMSNLGDYVAAGADVVETLTPPPVGDVDLAQAKELYGERTCLKGYVDLLYVLKMGTPELVEQTVREAIEVAAPGGGFILGTSDSIREGTPMENIRAYFEAAHRYGTYR
jgi:Uroporphyrinogen decarboxylase (URO-D)